MVYTPGEDPVLLVNFYNHVPNASDCHRVLHALGR